MALTPNPRIALATHEAGHAIVAAELGCTVEAISVEPDGKLNGRCLITPPARITTPELAAFLLAGELAESALFGRPWSPQSPHCWHDTAGLVELLLPARASDRRGIMPGAHGLNALAAHPIFWQGFQIANDVLDHRRADVFRLADQLLVRGTIRHPSVI